MGEELVLRWHLGEEIKDLAMVEVVVMGVVAGTLRPEEDLHTMIIAPHAGLGKFVSLSIV